MMSFSYFAFNSAANAVFLIAESPFSRWAIINSAYLLLATSRLLSRFVFVGSFFIVKDTEARIYMNVQIHIKETSWKPTWISGCRAELQVSEGVLPAWAEPRPQGPCRPGRALIVTVTVTAPRTWYLCGDVHVCLPWCLHKQVQKLCGDTVACSGEEKEIPLRCLWAALQQETRKHRIFAQELRNAHVYWWCKEQTDRWDYLRWVRARYCINTLGLIYVASGWLIFYASPLLWPTCYHCR